MPSEVRKTRWHGERSRPRKQALTLASAWLWRELARQVSGKSCPWQEEAIQFEDLTEDQELREGWRVAAMGLRGRGWTGQGSVSNQLVDG